MGNVSASCADLWSNESVQNVRLLSDYAPTVSMEQLEYDARLMNAALARGEELVLRDLFAASDLGREVIGDTTSFIGQNIPPMSAGDSYRLSFRLRRWPNLYEGDYTL